ncbi:MAG: L28p-like protein [Microgenomates group bacterium GW2011_GWC1_46_16]|nr:MAG: 50S ribosomal protein L28 [Microgenomates group bacterium GW2011_GWF1_46_12]KKU26675.1 MAG: L28p-like protein [Microgenomates group bacterium GW2011_GWC1_46_16]KKU28073.1 MAG: 50S ribosomal protein L28 [Microgenomates group bacterium GW2011_GWF2_46_18]KKU43978.1 MAG: 50S ribosomal protein L28 [Microgenomates group bacterium GW2011_GWA1_46_7]KKU45738.1 MAG: 50S ribosomal protein L28 [Microgenomates group bacterium GW2011_GWB1_46_7]KKU62890.1 MAG: 50S ribosomal protein L28 [Microgenomate
MPRLQMQSSAKLDVLLEYTPMANKCALCDKGQDVGHSVSHAKNRSQRIRKPNLHAHRMQIGESKLRLMLCTKCLRKVKMALPAKGE